MNYNEDTQLHANHLAILTDRWHSAMLRHKFDMVIIDAGEPALHLFDDQTALFRANPHLAQWLNTDDCEGSALVIKGSDRPQLLFLSENDYWLKAPEPPLLPDQCINISVFQEKKDITLEIENLLKSSSAPAYIGSPNNANFPNTQINPKGLITSLEYYRAYKTAFEIKATKEATLAAVQGHLMAKDCFNHGLSEIDIHLAYLKASRQSEGDLPYPNIIALNEHASILHYQRYDTEPPSQSRSFLIDAGARNQHYAADITRTYMAESKNEEAQVFKALLEKLDNAQQKLIATLRPGQKYLDLHEKMHIDIATILSETGLVLCNPQECFELGLTRSFLPHGLGHLLGIQTHDVGGHQIDPNGTEEMPPDYYETLRLTRTIEEEQIFTIEPGIYFIPTLLHELKSKYSRKLNWKLINALCPFGGMRIEDNILLHKHEVENLTRQAFSDVEEKN